MTKMTTSLVVAASLLVVGGCSKKKEEGTAQKPTEGSAANMPPPPPPPEAPKPMVGEELAKRYVECVGMIGANKLDELRKDCIDDSFTVHDYGDGSTRKAEDLLGWFKSMKEGMPDLKFEPQLIMISGRNILAVNLMTGTHTGTLKMPMGDVPATNKKLGMLMFHRLTINDANKATEEWAYQDPATMMGQLGLAPKDAPPTRPAMDKGWEGAPIIVVTKDDAAEKANLEASKKAIDAINAKKYGDLLGMMAPDAVESDQAGPKDNKGGKEMEASMKTFFGAFPDAKITAENSYAAGDYVVEMGKFTGTNTADMGKIKKTGKPVDLNYAEVMKFKDGKLTNVWRFHSGLMFAMQLGLMPPPGAPPAGGAAPAKPDDKKPAEPKKDEKK